MAPQPGENTVRDAGENPPALSAEQRPDTGLATRSSSDAQRQQKPSPAVSPSPAGATDPVAGVPRGVPVTVVPSKRESATQERGDSEKDAGDLDIEELARRLIEPVGRLLRAEFRQGRERIGRLHDRRR